MNTFVSDHITLIEATKSNVAIYHNIDNTPDDATFARMKIVAEAIFEPVRKRFGVAIGISSFYRCKALNAKIGGSTTSQHCTGEAIDIDGDMYGLISNRKIFDFIRENLVFDQLIWEFANDDETPAWVHVSYRAENNRMQVLQSFKNTFGATVYVDLKNVT